MIRLNLQSGPYWLPLGHDVEVEVRPFGTEVTMRVRDEMPDEIRAAILAGGAERSLALVKAFARAAIISWSGVGMVDGDGEVAPWPEAIDALMSKYPFGDTFERDYVTPGLLLDAEKKRINALAEWHFGGGAAYCAACPERCAECAYRLNAPLTIEGEAFWSALKAASNQVRTLGHLPLGIDFNALAAIAAAKGCPAAIVADFFPDAERIALAAIRQQIEGA